MPTGRRHADDSRETRSMKIECWMKHGVRSRWTDDDDGRVAGGTPHGGGAVT